MTLRLLYRVTYQNKIFDLTLLLFTTAVLGSIELKIGGGGFFGPRPDTPPACVTKNPQNSFWALWTQEQPWEKVAVTNQKFCSGRSPYCSICLHKSWRRWHLLRSWLSGHLAGPCQDHMKNNFSDSRQLTVHWQPTMLKLHRNSGFTPPESQNCHVGIYTARYNTVGCLVLQLHSWKWYYALCGSPPGG